VLGFGSVGAPRDDDEQHYDAGNPRHPTTIARGVAFIPQFDTVMVLRAKNHSRGAMINWLVYETKTGMILSFVEGLLL